MNDNTEPPRKKFRFISSPWSESNSDTTTTKIEPFMDSIEEIYEQRKKDIIEKINASLQDKIVQAISSVQVDKNSTQEIFNKVVGAGGEVDFYI